MTAGTKSKQIRRTRRPPEKPAARHPSHTQAGFSYPPEIEARRADYEQIARAFSALIQIESEHGGDLLHIDLPYGVDVVPRADLVGTIQDHLYRLHLDVDWFNPETMSHLYVEMRMQADYWRWQHAQLNPDGGKPVQRAKPRGIVALYTRLGELMGEVLEHEECADTIADALSNAWLKLRDQYKDIPKEIRDDFARLARQGG